MRYKRRDISDQPEWLRDGPVWCEATYKGTTIRTHIVWYGTVVDKYIDIFGDCWDTAEPIEAWEPEPYEPVIVWANHMEHARIRVYRDVIVTTWDHIARMPDHRLESLKVKYIESLGLEAL